jgi:hypothetical protein
VSSPRRSAAKHEAAGVRWVGFLWPCQLLIFVAIDSPLGIPGLNNYRLELQHMLVLAEWFCSRGRMPAALGRNAQVRPSAAPPFRDRPLSKYSRDHHTLSQNVMLFFGKYCGI